MSQLSKSSDYFDNDPEFLKALAEVALPGSISNLSGKSEDKDRSLSSGNQYDVEETKMPPSTQPCLKRRYRDSSDDEGQSQNDSHHNVLTSIAHSESDATYLNSNTYGASHFGDWGEYMRRKRQKLQVQNTEINEGGTSSHMSQIFRGIQIYVSHGLNC
jgi:DNA repair protein REV1